MYRLFLLAPLKWRMCAVVLAVLCLSALYRQLIWLLECRHERLAWVVQNPRPVFNKTDAAEATGLLWLHEYMLHFHGLGIRINDACAPPLRISPGEIVTMRIPNRPKHICVYRDSRNNRTYIMLPEHRGSELLHTIPEPQRYDGPSQDLLLVPTPHGIWHVSWSRTNHSQAIQALFWITGPDSPLDRQYQNQRRAYEQYTLWLNRLDHPATLIVLQLAIAAFCIWLAVLRGLDVQISSLASKLASNEAQELALSQHLKDTFAAYFLREGLTAALKREMAEEVRRWTKFQRDELYRKRNLERKERLRQTQPAKAAQIEQRMRTHELQVRERVKQNKAKPVDEIRRVREEFMDQSSDIQRLLQSDVLDLIIETATEESAAPPRETKRDKWLYRVRAVCHTLSGLEDMPDADLKRFAKLARGMKRNMGENWLKFTTRFNGNEPSTYSQVLQLASSGTYCKLNELLSEKPSMPAQSEEECTPEMIRPYFAGQSVLIIGGDPSLGNFYAEQFKLLKARQTRYFHPDDTRRLREAKGDIGVVLWDRVSHRQNQILKAKKIKIVYIQHVARSNFLLGAINDLEDQL